MLPDKLADMADHIGPFVAHQPHDKAVASIEAHLRRFWDPRTRAGIVATGCRIGAARACGKQLNA
jgi:hypothetical protein